jgi:hypothetical protein
MMSEVHEAEGDALGEVVDALGRTARDVRPVPRGDLCSPLLDGPSEAANLDGHRVVRAVADDLSNPLVGEFGVAVGVCLTNDFLRVSCQPDFLSRVASAQQADQSFVLVDGESLGRDRESTPDSPERIVVATAMPTGLVLHPPTHLAVAMPGSSSHQQRPHVVQRQRCLRHTNLVGRLNAGRSTNLTSRIPCRCTTQTLAAGSIAGSFDHHPQPVRPVADSHHPTHHPTHQTRRTVKGLDRKA